MTMCTTCDGQERVCPAEHVQPKHHGDVFRGDVLCTQCGATTTIRTSEWQPQRVSVRDQQNGVKRYRRTTGHQLIKTSLTPWVLADSSGATIKTLDWDEATARRQAADYLGRPRG